MDIERKRAKMIAKQVKVSLMKQRNDKKKMISKKYRNRSLKNFEEPIYHELPILLVNMKVAQHTLKYQSVDILVLIFKELDPITFCNFREACVEFADISRHLIEGKKKQYLDNKYNAIEERRHQAWLREKAQGYIMTRHGRESLRNYEEEGLPFGYYSDDYSPYNSDDDNDINPRPSPPRVIRRLSFLNHVPTDNRFYHIGDDLSESTESSDDEYYDSNDRYSYCIYEYDPEDKYV